MSTIARQLEAVRAEIAAACAGAGRDPGTVTLVAVSKRKPDEDVFAAYAAGQRDFGENYAQGLRDRRYSIDVPGLRWHFIGPLQRNKVKYVVGTAALIQSVDSARLLAAIDGRAAQEGLVQEVLIQVNIAREPQKAGVSEDELAGLIEGFAGLDHVRCRGLMVMPPFDDDPERSRPYFQQLRSVAQAHRKHERPGVSLDELSMGMSHDYRVAIEEGATIVRVGTAIFGARQ